MTGFVLVSQRGIVGYPVAEGRFVGRKGLVGVGAVVCYGGAGKWETGKRGEKMWHRHDRRMRRREGVREGA